MKCDKLECSINEKGKCLSGNAHLWSSDNCTPKIIYTFHREEGFYPLNLSSDEEALANAKRNPGTLKVINTKTDKIIFEV